MPRAPRREEEETPSYILGEPNSAWTAFDTRIEEIAARPPPPADHPELPAMERARCERCDMRFPVSERMLAPEPYRPNDSRAHCPACHNTVYPMCQGGCETRHPTRLQFRVVDYRTTGAAVLINCCRTCRDDWFSQCPQCSNFVDQDHMHGIRNADSVCPACYEADYFECESCGYAYHNDNYGEDGSCRACCEEEEPAPIPDEIINSHNTKVPAVFRGKGPLFYGVELEVELRHSAEVRYDRYERATEVLRILNPKGEKPFVIIKSDGSLTNGFEIVTTPTGREEHIKMWAPFFKSLPKGLRSFDTRTCGLHVHVSRKPLGLSIVPKLVKFMNARENQGFIEMIAGRPSTSYCQYKDKTPRDLRNSVARTRDDRYEALNTTNKDTIEFRIFKGTLKEHSLHRAIEFCDAVIRYCSPANEGWGDLVYDRFADFVINSRSEYPRLYGFLKAKFYYQESPESKLYGYKVPDGEE